MTVSFVRVYITRGFYHPGYILFSRNKTWSFLWKFSSSIVCWLDESLSSHLLASSGLRRSSGVICLRKWTLCNVTQINLRWVTLISEEGLWRAQPWFLTLQSWLSNVLGFSELSTNNYVHRNHTERLRDDQKLNEDDPSLRCRFYGSGVVPGICIFLDKHLKNSYASDSKNTLKNTGVNCQWILFKLKRGDFYCVSPNDLNHSL